jgi:hypothetical protein
MFGGSSVPSTSWGAPGFTHIIQCLNYIAMSLTYLLDGGGQDGETVSGLDGGCDWPVSTEKGVAIVAVP